MELIKNVSVGPGSPASEENIRGGSKLPTTEPSVALWIGGIFRRLPAALSDFHNRTVLFRRGRIIFVTYGVLVALAFVSGLGAAMTFFDWSGHDPYLLLRFSALLLLPSVLVGARLFSVLLDWRQLLSSPLQALLKPGYMLHGGVFGGAMATLWYSRNAGVSSLAMTDAWAFALPLGEAICRIGCHVYGCCWGKPTCSGWGIRYTSPDAKVVRCAPQLAGKPLHPVQIYGTIGHLMLFAILILIAPWLSHEGTLTAVYLIAHSALRVGLERFRQDDRGQLTGPFTHTNLYSAIQLLSGIILLVAPVRTNRLVLGEVASLTSSYLQHPDAVLYLGVIAIGALGAFGLHVDRVGTWLSHKN